MMLVMMLSLSVPGATPQMPAYLKTGEGTEALYLLVVDVLEDVFETSIILLQDSVFGA